MTQKKLTPKKEQPLKVTKTDDGLSLDIGEKKGLSGVAARTFGTSDTHLASHLMGQAMDSHGQYDDPNMIAGNATLALLHGIKPRNELEGVLAVQMVAVHNMSMEFTRRALVKGQPPIAVDANVNRANKLMRTFTAQIEALQRYRGKGQQTIKVQYVHINKGAQAVVGNLNHKGGGIIGKWKSPPHAEIRRCGAKTRAGHPCGRYAMKNGRCRLHGGLSTGAKIPYLIHGYYTHAGIQDRRRVTSLIRASRVFLRETEKMS